MKKSMIMVIAVVAMCAFAGVAHAYPVVLSSVYNPADILLSTSSQPLTYTHTLTDFNSATDTFVLLGSTLSINLRDDAIFDGSERVDISLNGIDQDGLLSETFLASMDETFWWGVEGMLDQTNGILTVTLTPTQGDFYFESSELYSLVDRNPSASPVPEPATMALLGIGVFGLVGLKRRA